jgi:hypothetical protein
MNSRLRNPGLDRVPQFLVDDSLVLAWRLPVNDFAPIERYRRLNEHPPTSRPAVRTRRLLRAQGEQHEEGQPPLSTVPSPHFVFR